MSLPLFYGSLPGAEDVICAWVSMVILLGWWHDQDAEPSSITSRQRQLSMRCCRVVVKTGISPDAFDPNQTSNCGLE